MPASAQANVGMTWLLVWPYESLSLSNAAEIEISSIPLLVCGKVVILQHQTIRLWTVQTKARYRVTWAV